MDARLTRYVCLFGIVVLSGLAPTQAVAQQRSQNFVITSRVEPAFAKQLLQEGERFRKELAIQWLGSELPPWPEPCPITVHFEPHAGGETSFAFIRTGNGTSRPTDWKMDLFGPPERILDSVLPHEITHTIFATHFGRQLPRWADEGACTTVECSVERQRSQQMLIDFLMSNRGIPFNHMVSMYDYPRDILPLYAQGHSVVRYLIMQGGHQKFIDFVGHGMKLEPGNSPIAAWDAAIRACYGYDDLSDLQVSWQSWVQKGSRDISVDDTAIAAAPPANPSRPSELAIQSEFSEVAPVTVATATARAPSESWYVRQSLAGHSRRLPLGNNDPRALATPPSAYAPGSVQTQQIAPALGADTSRTLWR